MCALLMLSCREKNNSFCYVGVESLCYRKCCFFLFERKNDLILKTVPTQCRMDGTLTQGHSRTIILLLAMRDKKPFASSDSENMDAQFVLSLDGSILLCMG